MRHSRHWLSCFGAAAAFAAMGTQTVHAQMYDFRPIVTSDDFDPFGFDVPAVNNAGFVAFAGTLLDGTTGVFRSNGTTLTPIALNTDFRRFGDVSINNAGQVGFEASFRTPRGEGILRGDGGAVTTIAGTRNAGDFDFVNAGPSLNASGQVAFIGERIVGGNFIDGVYVGNGGAVNAIYDTTANFSDFTGNPSLNDSGTAAFLASLSNGTGGLFVGNGGAFTTVADDSGVFTAVFGFSDPSLNDQGAVAFRAGTNVQDPTDNSGSTATGIFLYENGVLTTIIEDAVGGLDFGDPSLNNQGKVAYLTIENFSDYDLVIGDDPVGGRIIGTGDMLLGRTISSLSFGREGFNDNGQLTFTAFFDDGTSAIFLASPNSVPEPSNAVLLISLVSSGVVLARRRRG
jgi:hypothetical protein